MRCKPFTTLLAAGVIGATGSLSFAQMDTDADVNADLDVTTSERQDLQSTDRQDLQRTDRQNLQRSDRHTLQSRDAQAGDQKTLSGTVVSLERYLKEGKSAAQSSSAAMASNTGPKALIADDGEVYIILSNQGQANQRMSSTDSWQSDRDATARRSAVGSTTGSAAARADMDMNRQAAQRPEQDPPLASTPGYEIDDKPASPSNDANAAVTARSDTSRDSEVYGMASPQHDRGVDSQLRIGEKMELTGVVHERDGLQGITVTNVRSSME